MKTLKKRNILLSAFVCHPYKGSEEAVGWNWLRELSKNHKVYALVSTFQCQDTEIKAAVEKLSNRENIHLIFIPFPPKTSKFLSLFPLLEFYVQCVEWQKEALLEAQKLTEKVDIDIVHHVTYATWTVPSVLWKMSKPFVLGPVSGSQKVPVIGYFFIPPKGILKEVVRMLFYAWARFPLSLAKESVKRSSIVLCSNLETLEEMNLIRASRKNVFMSEVGISYLPAFFDSSEGRGCLLQKENGSVDVYFLWAGLFEPRKNFGLLLASLLLLPNDIQWKLFAAGDGPLKSYWQERVYDSGMGSKIVFLGQVPYEEMSNYYQKSDIFLFPSLREGTGTVLVEAMSYGLPIVALNLNGARTLLSENCGVLVDIIRPKQVVRDYAKAVECLSRNQTMRYEIGRKAREKVREQYLWEAKVVKMASIYEDLIGRDI